MFSCRSFMVSGLTFKFLIYFEFIFVYDIRYKINSFHMEKELMQFSLHHLLKTPSFHYHISFAPLSKIKISGQDGGIGRLALLPHTIKRRTTKKLKTKNNQNCQEIELYASPTTEELKKKHSSSLVGGVEVGSWGGKVVDRPARHRLVDLVVPHSHRISQEEQLGSKTDRATQGSSAGK